MSERRALVAEQLRELIVRSIVEVAPDVDPSAIDPSEDLAQQLALDSMDMLTILAAVGERTGVDIPERDYPRLDTLEHAVAYLLAARR